MAKPFAALCLLLAGMPAQAAQSAWVIAEQAQARLLIAQSDDGRLTGGLEIVLEPGWHTYWRNPGEAGVPPVFDFSASQNVADVRILYPAPERYDDGTSVSLIYRDQVVFPLAVTPADATAPVTLAVNARFGVCRDICIPTQAAASLTQPAGLQSDPLTAARLSAFLARVPTAPVPQHFALESVELQGDTLTIDVRMPESTYADLFAEPPRGWYIGQPAFVSRGAGISRYSLSLAGRPRDARASGERFRFVAVSGGEAIEESVELR